MLRVLEQEMSNFVSHFYVFLGFEILENDPKKINSSIESKKNQEKATFSIGKN